LWAIFQFLVDGGIFERRIRSAVVKANLKSVRGAECEVQLLNTGIFGSAGALPPRKVIHQSLIASCYLPFTIHYSPFATRCRFGSAGALPSQFIPPFVPRPVFKSVATKTKPAKAG